VLELHDTVQSLAEFPEMGADADFIRSGSRRMNAGSHVVFYRRTEAGILILRVLHQNMDFTLHL
jgi:toxin ParE1/3/4